MWSNLVVSHTIISKDVSQAGSLGQSLLVGPSRFGFRFDEENVSDGPILIGHQQIYILLVACGNIASVRMDSCVLVPLECQKQASVYPVNVVVHSDKSIAWNEDAKGFTEAGLEFFRHMEFRIPEGLGDEEESFLPVEGLQVLDKFGHGMPRVHLLDSRPLIQAACLLSCMPDVSG